MNILTVSEFYLDDTNANAHCARIIADALADAGAEVYVVCVSNEDTPEYVSDRGVHVIPVTDRDRYKIDAMRKARAVLSWPLTRPKTAKAVCSRMEQLISSAHFDGVLAMYKSYLSAYCTMKIKKAHPELKTSIYLLDAMVNSIDKGVIKFLYYKEKPLKGRIYRSFDHIINMRCNSNDFSAGDPKVVMCDFPLIVEGNEIADIRRDDDQIRIAYFGVLERTFRSPEFAMNVFVRLKEKHDIKVTFYTKGTSVEDMKRIAAEHPGIFEINGYVARDELLKVIGESDALINIGNGVSTMVPSKVFDLVSYGKPIIHFSKQETDMCDLYFGKYGKAVIVKEAEGVDKAADQIEAFIGDLDRLRSLKADLSSGFSENTPKHSADVIIGTFV